MQLAVSQPSLARFALRKHQQRKHGHSVQKPAGKGRPLLCMPCFPRNLLARGPMLRMLLCRGAATAASDLQSSSTGIASLPGCHVVAAHACISPMCKTLSPLACKGVWPTALCVRQALPVTPGARDLPATQLQAVCAQYVSLPCSTQSQIVPSVQQASPVTRRSRRMSCAWARCLATPRSPSGGTGERFAAMLRRCSLCMRHRLATVPAGVSLTERLAHRHPAPAVLTLAGGTRREDWVACFVQSRTYRQAAFASLQRC